MVTVVRNCFALGLGLVTHTLKYFIVFSVMPTLLVLCRNLDHFVVVLSLGAYCCLIHYLGFQLLRYCEDWTSVVLFTHAALLSVYLLFGLVGWIYFAKYILPRWVNLVLFCISGTHVTCQQNYRTLKSIKLMKYSSNLSFGKKTGLTRVFSWGGRTY